VYSTNSFVVNSESGFSVYRLPATEGMFASVTDDQPKSGAGYHWVSLSVSLGTGR
jgi:hypothetical protein